MINDILKVLRESGTESNRQGQKRFGIQVENAFGVTVPVLRGLAKKYKNNHELALQLWETGFHEARLLAALIDNPKMVTEAQLETWVLDIDSWDLCDCLCFNLFDKLPFAIEKAYQLCEREAEYVRRTGFVIIASIAVHDKKADDKLFIDFLPMLEKFAFDNRNFVKKAVNWTLRQIGKRNKNLLEIATQCALHIQQQDSKSAKWIAADALREFNNEKIIKRVEMKSQK